MHKKLAKFSLKYIIIIVFVILLFFLIIGLFLSNLVDSKIESSRFKINILANNTLNEAKAMYYSGGYSIKSIEYILPETISAFYLTGEHHDQLVFEIKTLFGKKDFIYYSEVPLRFPFPINDSASSDKNKKIVNLNTIYLINDETNVLICTNLNIERECSKLS